MEARLNNCDFELISSVVNAVQEDRYYIQIKSIYHPNNFSAIIYNETTKVRLHIYIWNLTNGDDAERLKDEYRIQITGVDRFIKLQDEKTLILGWWEDVGVFVGFDFYKHNGKLGYSPSIQIREENLRRALLNGFSACDRGNGEIAIAFRPDFFVEYIINLESLHKIGESRKEIEIVEEVVSGNLEVNSQEIHNLSKPRRTFITNLNKKLRDNSFKRRVLNAYGNQCAFSGLQLKLVDAAHIVPVTSEKSTDETSNGVALSALYHRAYDRGFIAFNEKYQIVVNEKEMNKLKSIGFDGGMDKFIKSVKPIMVVPPAINDRPNINYIRVANKLRGWSM